MTMLIIKIESERLALVPIEQKHAIDIYDNFTHEITKYMYPKPAAQISETEDFIKSSHEKMKKESDIVLAILRKDTREFLGCAGFHNPKSKTPEFGIWIKKTSHGNGYGKEAITALYDWVCGKFEFDYILYPVDKRNIASRKIPESLGGVIKKEYKEKNLVGFELDEVEYHIFPKK